MTANGPRANNARGALDSAAAGDKPARLGRNAVEKLRQGSAQAGDILGHRPDLERRSSRAMSRITVLLARSPLRKAVICATMWPACWPDAGTGPECRRRSGRWRAQSRDLGAGHAALEDFWPSGSGFLSAASRGLIFCSAKVRADVFHVFRRQRSGHAHHDGVLRARLELGQLRRCSRHAGQPGWGWRRQRCCRPRRDRLRTIARPALYLAGSALWSEQPASWQSKPCRREAGHSQQLGNLHENSLRFLLAAPARPRTALTRTASLTAVGK